jgi:hypothetical protein
MPNEEEQVYCHEFLTSGICLENVPNRLIFSRFDSIHKLFGTLNVKREQPDGRSFDIKERCLAYSSLSPNGWSWLISTASRTYWVSGSRNAGGFPAFQTFYKVRNLVNEAVFVTDLKPGTHHARKDGRYPCVDGSPTAQAAFVAVVEIL